MKLRDWWPAILISPLVLFLPAVWQQDRESVSAMRSVDARIVKVQQYKCTTGRVRSRTSRRCWEITREYRTPDGVVHYKLDFYRGGSDPHVGDWSTVLVSTGAAGSIADGTDETKARRGPFGYTLFACGFFALACYASVLRARRRREREPASAQTA